MKNSSKLTHFDLNQPIFSDSCAQFFDHELESKLDLWFGAQKWSNSRFLLQINRQCQIYFRNNSGGNLKSSSNSHCQNPPYVTYSLYSGTSRNSEFEVSNDWTYTDSSQTYLGKIVIIGHVQFFKLKFWSENQVWVSFDFMAWNSSFKNHRSHRSWMLIANNLILPPTS